MSRKGFFLHNEIIDCSDDFFCNTLQKCWIPWQLSSMPQNSTFRTVKKNDKFGEFFTCQPYSAEEPHFWDSWGLMLWSLRPGISYHSFLSQFLLVPNSLQSQPWCWFFFSLFTKGMGFFLCSAPGCFPVFNLAPSFSEAPFSSHFGLLLRWITDTSRQVVSKLTWEVGTFRDGALEVDFREGWVKVMLGDKTGLQEGQNMGHLMPRA